MSSILLMGCLVYMGGSRRNGSIGIPRLLQVPSAVGGAKTSEFTITPYRSPGTARHLDALVKPNTLYQLGNLSKFLVMLRIFYAWLSNFSGIFRH